MEQMTTFSARPGFALPVVLFIAVLGILLGIGRLMTFSYQCRLRLDRQQEYEKILAVRSALNRLQNAAAFNFPTEGGKDETMTFHTDSGRNVKVVVHPADAVFPNTGNANHFCVNRTTAASRKSFTHIEGTKYRYASSVSGDSTLRRDSSDKYIFLMSENALSNDLCRVSIDMSDTGRWSDDPFGRRYAFNIGSLWTPKGTGGTNDTIRFILRRKRRNESFNGFAGAPIDWRPSPAQTNESVIYAELRTGGAGDGYFRASTFRRDAHGESLERECVSYGIASSLSTGEQQMLDCYGIQLVGQNMTLFHVTSNKGIYKQYDLIGTGPIPDDVYGDFTNNVETTLSTNLVMELEVEASPSRASASSGIGENGFSHFEVYPAFEFEISIENENEREVSGIPITPTMATVVHLNFADPRSPSCTAISYDTHGTEIKGWRTGERMAWGVRRH